MNRTARYIRGLIDAGMAEPAASAESVARAAVGMVATFAARVAFEPAYREEAVADLTAMYVRLLGLRT